MSREMMEQREQRNASINSAESRKNKSEAQMKNSGIEWIGEIPKEWEERKFGNICSVVTDFVASGSFADLRQNVTYLDYPDYAMLVRTTDLANSIRSEKRVYISKESYDFLQNSNLHGGEVVLPNIGSIGDVYIVPSDLYPKMSLAPNAIMFKTQLCDKYYFYYFLSKIGNLQLQEISQSTAMDKFNKTDLKSLRVICPPLSEQQKIANYLDKVCGEVDEMIALQKQMIEELKAYKQSVITEAVTKGLNPDVPMKDSGIDWIGEVPKHWGTPAISYVAAISSGSTPDRNNPLFWKNGDINWIKTGELQNNRISESEEKVTEHALNNTSLKLYPKNTILIAMYGQGKTRGMTALLDVPCTTNQACAALSVRNDNLCCEYLWKCLMGAYDAIREKAVGTGQPNLNSELISKFVITLPPINEQKEIVNYIDEIIPQIDALIAIKQAKIEELKEYKKSVIYEYVTGKKEVV